MKRAFEILFWLLVVAAFFAFPERRVLGTQILIAALFALSLDLVMGFAGIVTLGHAAFFGTGAYVAGWLGQNGWSEPLSGVLAAALAAAILGVLTARIVGRGNDLSRLMITLGLGMLLFEIANKASGLTGGVDGMQDITIAPVLGRFAFGMSGTTAYVYCACWLFGIFLLLRHATRQPFGLALHAMRLNPLRSAAIGIDNGRARGIAYALSAAIAGVAGALLAQTSQYVALDALSFQRSADVTSMLIIGGTGTLYGGPIGAAVFLVAQDVLSGINPVYWQFWLGLILVLVMLFARGGLIGTGKRLLGRRRG